jgi:hypothetical protein
VRPAALPLGGSVVATLGGIEEETIAEQYDSALDAEEIIVCDWRDDDPAHNAAGNCPGPAPRVSKNVGLPPVEPAQSLVSEVTDLVFRRLWNDIVVPQLVLSVRQTAPSQRAQQKREERKTKQTTGLPGAASSIPDRAGGGCSSFVNDFVREQQLALASASPPRRIRTPTTATESSLPLLPQLRNSSSSMYCAGGGGGGAVHARKGGITPVDPAGPVDPTSRPVIIPSTAARRAEAKKVDERRSHGGRRPVDEPSSTPEPGAKSNNRRSVCKPLVPDDDLVIVGVSNGKEQEASSSLPRLDPSKSRAQTANPRNHGMLPNKRVAN